MFKACMMVIRCDIQSARFLMPYLLQNVIASGSPEARKGEQACAMHVPQQGIQEMGFAAASSPLDRRVLRIAGGNREDQSSRCASSFTITTVPAMQVVQGRRHNTCVCFGSGFISSTSTFPTQKK